MQTLQSMFPFHQIHAKVGIISWDAWGSCPCTPPPMEMLRPASETTFHYFNSCLHCHTKPAGKADPSPWDALGCYFCRAV